MFSAIWIATAIGLVGGTVISYVLARAALPRLIMRSQDRSLMVRLAFAGTVVALLPAFFVSFVVGGTLGGAWGEYLFRQLGLGPAGVPFGLAVGIALVLAVVLLGGAAVGVLSGKAVLYYRQWRMRTMARRSPQR